MKEILLTVYYTTLNTSMQYPQIEVFDFFNHMKINPV